MNKILMKRPSWLKDNKYKISFWGGLKVRSKFYDQCLVGSLRVDNIPEELKKTKWVPDDDKVYKCWWYYTNPADPADPGEDILVYIEEVEKNEELDMILALQSEIIEKVRKMDIDHLERVKKFIKYM